MNTPTPTINGLRLVSPEEAGVESKDRHGNEVVAIVMKGEQFKWYVWQRGVNGGIVNSFDLLPLPKPRTTRPHKRGEVKLGDAFRHKEKGWDKLVVFVGDGAIDLGFDNISYERLLEDWERLTYDPDTGKEVLSVAGVVE